MPITTDQVPIKGGVLADALETAKQDPDLRPETGKDIPLTTKQIDEQRAVKADTTYTVLVSSKEEGPFSVIGEFTVAGGQRAARAAAVEANEGLKTAILNGEGPTLVAVANWNPTTAGVKNVDPQIQV